MSADNAAAYAAARARISALVKVLDVSVASTPVPACPEWTVREVVAHLTGICDDILSGNLGGVATEPWTAAQVEKRKADSIADIVREWDDAGSRIEQMLPNFPAAPASQLVFDLVTHEHDLRAALGRPGARDSDGVGIGLGFGMGGFLSSVSSRNLPPLRVCAGDREWTSTEGEAQVTLRTVPFDLLRSIAGRRSLAQVRSLDWDGDAEPYLPAFEWGPFKPPASDLSE
jgi:uncharacterized protein (TIGR03083 family)